MRRALLGLGLVPLIGPALFLGALTVADTLAGEGLFLYHLTYEKRLLLTQFMSDYIAALPGAYILAALLIGVGLGVQRISGASRMLFWMCAVGAVAGLGLGTFLAATASDPGAWALGLSGLFYAAALALHLGRVLKASTAASAVE